MTFLLRKICPLRNPSMLHHHLFCSSNFGDKTLIKLCPSISRGDDPLITFMKTYWGEQLPKKWKLITLMRNYRGEQLQKKLKQFDKSLGSLRTISDPLFWDFNDFRKSSRDEIDMNVSKFRRLVVGMDSQTYRQRQTRENLEIKLINIIKSINRLKEITNEGFHLYEALINYKIASYDENIKKLSEIRKDFFSLKDFASLHEELEKAIKWNNEEEEEESNDEELQNNEEVELNEKLWNELYDDLWDVDWDRYDEMLMEWRECQLLDAKELDMKTDKELTYLSVNYKQLYEIRNFLFPKL